MRFFSALILFTCNIILYIEYFRVQRSILEEQQNFNQCLSCEWTYCWNPVQAICVRPVCPVLPSLKLTVPLRPSLSAQEIPARFWADLGKENNGREMPLPGQVIEPALIFQVFPRRAAVEEFVFSILARHIQPADHQLGPSALTKIYNSTQSTSSLSRVSRHPCHCLGMGLREICWIFERKKNI